MVACYRPCRTAWSSGAFPAQKAISDTGVFELLLMSFPLGWRSSGIMDLKTRWRDQVQWMVNRTDTYRRDDFGDLIDVVGNFSLWRVASVWEFQHLLSETETGSTPQAMPCLSSDIPVSSIWKAGKTRAQHGALRQSLRRNGS
jgi:hypothetical protein